MLALWSFMSVCHPFPLLIQLTILHETLYKYYIIENHHNAIFCNFLQVITVTWADVCHVI